MIELLLQADRLLTVDMIDQADAIYRKVAEADPHNAIAVVGMGRCALARGDDHEAYRLAARALKIDPQNDMARRMEARLDEVLRTRGEVPGETGDAPVDAAPAPIAPGAPRPTSRWPAPHPTSPLPGSQPVAAPQAQPAPAPAPSVVAPLPSAAPSAALAQPNPPPAPSAASPAPSVVPRPSAAAPAPSAAPAPAPARRGLLDRLRGR